MINKIDSSLLHIVTDNISGNDKIKCVVYVNNLCDNVNNMVENCEYYPFINAVVCDVKNKDIIKLACDADVSYITSLTKVSSCVNVAKKIIEVDNAKVEKNNLEYSIAVIDTGIYPHLDFVFGKNNLLAFYDIVNNKTVPYDDNGHGTFVSGLIMSKGLVSGGKYAGIDPEANLVAIKALDYNGETTSVNILKAMQWVYDNKDKYNIKIVCMSFGSVVLENNDPLVVGAEKLWDAGITVCCACGNNGPESSSVKSPGSSSKVITVGAMDDHRVGDSFDKTSFKVADFSSRGPIFNRYKPDCIVSGVDVVSACNFDLNKKFYSKMSGTSVSTPIIAGVTSLILKRNKFFKPNQIKKFITSNCNVITGDRNIEGFGWFNFKKI